jgi:hypothetical protein
MLSPTCCAFHARDLNSKWCALCGVKESHQQVIGKIFPTNTVHGSLIQSPHSRFQDVTPLLSIIVIPTIASDTQMLQIKEVRPNAAV